MLGGDVIGTGKYDGVILGFTEWLIGGYRSEFLSGEATGTVPVGPIGIGAGDLVSGALLR